MNRQKKLLAILVALLVLSVGYAFWSTPTRETIDPSVVTSPSGGQNGQLSRTPKGVADAEKLQLELLEPENKKYTGYRRNIFAFYVPKPQPITPPPQPVTPPPQPIATPVVTPQIREQLARFTFLGFLLKNNERTVFLSKQDELFLVRKNETFGEQNRFEVVDISPEMLTIRQQGAAGLIEIPLVEKEPLIPSFSPGELRVRPDLPPILSDAAEEPIQVSPEQDATPAENPAATPYERRRRWFQNPQAVPTTNNENPNQ